MFRASTSAGILGARVCSLCRTYCDCNTWLRFSPYRVLRLHMHLSWGTSRQHIQCLRRATQVLEYLAPAPLTYAAHFATTTSGFGSLPVVPTSIPAPVVQYIAPTPIEYAAPAPVMVYIALAQAVSYAVPANRWLRFSLCRTHRLQLFTLAASCAYMFTQQRLLLCSC